MRRFLRRLRLSATRRGDEARLQEEVRAHLDRQADENRRAGMAPAEARRQAVLAFGHVEALKDQYRDEQRLPLVDNFARDVRYALRQLRRSPVFAATAMPLARDGHRRQRRGVFSVRLGAASTTAVSGLP